MPWQMIKKALLLAGAIQLPIIEINSEYLNTKEIVKKTLKTDPVSYTHLTLPTIVSV